MRALVHWLLPAGMVFLGVTFALDLVLPAERFDEVRYRVVHGRRVDSLEGTDERGRAFRAFLHPFHGFETGTRGRATRVVVSRHPLGLGMLRELDPGGGSPRWASPGWAVAFHVLQDLLAILLTLVFLDWWFEKGVLRRLGRRAFDRLVGRTART